MSSLETSAIRTEFGTSFPLGMGLSLGLGILSQGALWLGSKVFLLHEDYKEEYQKKICKIVGSIVMIAAAVFTLFSVCAFATYTGIGLSLLAFTAGGAASKVLTITGAALGLLGAGSVALSSSRSILKPVLA